MLQLRWQTILPAAARRITCGSESKFLQRSWSRCQRPPTMAKVAEMCVLSRIRGLGVRGSTVIWSGIEFWISWFSSASFPPSPFSPDQHGRPQARRCRASSRSHALTSSSLISWRRWRLNVEPWWMDVFPFLSAQLWLHYMPADLLVLATCHDPGRDKVTRVRPTQKGNLARVTWLAKRSVICCALGHRAQSTTEHYTPSLVYSTYSCPTLRQTLVVNLTYWFAQLVPTFSGSLAWPSPIPRVLYLAKPRLYLRLHPYEAVHNTLTTLN